MSGHIAVVPVSSADAHALAAVEYAAARASQVVALHLRTRSNLGVEAEWRMSGSALPLVIVDVPNGDQTAALRRALAVLERTEQPDRITLVVPWGDEPLEVAPRRDGRGVLVVEQAPSATRLE